MYTRYKQNNVLLMLAAALVLGVLGFLGYMFYIDFSANLNGAFDLQSMGTVDDDGLLLMARSKIIFWGLSAVVFLKLSFDEKYFAGKAMERGNNSAGLALAIFSILGLLAAGFLCWVVIDGSARLW